MDKRSALGGVATLTTALGINAVPAGGLFVAGWAAETAMLLYLIENVVAVALSALRVRLLAPVRDDTHTAGGKPQTRAELLQGFLLVGGVFSMGSAIFLLFFIFVVLRSTGDWGALRYGAANMVTFQIIGFASDLFTLRPLGLSRAAKLLEQSLGRVFLLYLAVFVGIFLALFSNAWFLVPFIALKTMVDIGQPIQFLFNRGAKLAVG